MYQFVNSDHVKLFSCQCHSVGDNIPHCFIKGKVIGSWLVLPGEDEENIKNSPARFDLIKLSYTSANLTS